MDMQNFTESNISRLQKLIDKIKQKSDVAKVTIIAPERCIDELKGKFPQEHIESREENCIFIVPYSAIKMVFDSETMRIYQDKF